MRTESSRWIPAPGSVNRPEVFVRSMRASATSVRFVIQEKTAQTAIRILNGFQGARSQTRRKNTANRIKDGRIQKSLANIQRFYAEPVLNRKKAENRTGHHGKKLQKIPHDKGPEWDVHTQQSPLVSI